MIAQRLSAGSATVWRPSPPGTARVQRPFCVPCPRHSALPKPPYPPLHHPNTRKCGARWGPRLKRWAILFRPAKRDSVCAPR